MHTPDQTAAPEPPRPSLSVRHRWLYASAWLQHALLNQWSAARLSSASDALAELLPWEDRKLLLAVLVDASSGDRAELVDWLAEALGAVALQPEVRFGALAEEAEAWAALASEAEIKAWLLACVGRLPAAERVKFVAAVQRQAVSAVAS